MVWSPVLFSRKKQSESEEAKRKMCFFLVVFGLLRAGLVDDLAYFLIIQ